MQPYCHCLDAHQPASYLVLVCSVFNEIFIMFREADRAIISELSPLKLFYSIWSKNFTYRRPCSHIVFCIVDGILSALEDRCLVTNSPVSIIAAAILGDKLRSLTVDSMLLTDEARVLMFNLFCLIIPSSKSVMYTIVVKRSNQLSVDKFWPLD